MKLYATITSERATKGQGGNDRIDIQLQGKNGVELGVIALRYNEFMNVYTINYLHNGIYPIAQISGTTLKANNQKDENYLFETPDQTIKRIKNEIN